MPSVFKRGRDKGKRNAVWYFSYDDENGRRKTKKGFTDKQSTEQLARELERQARRKKEGLVDPNDLKRKTAAETPIEDHLQAFETSISKNTGKHVKLTMTRVRRLVTEAEIKTLADIEIESLEAVLGDMLDAGEIGHKTYNHYVQSMSQFCNWLVPDRIAASPVAGMARLNADVDVRHPRRALSPEEFSKLVSSARSSDVSIPVLHRRGAGTNLHPFFHDWAQKKGNRIAHTVELQTERLSAYGHGRGDELKAQKERRSSASPRACSDASRLASRPQTERAAL